ncbi:MAG: hypothetical protein AB7O28_01390 [Vicinamibacterales bacterium]
MTPAGRVVPVAIGAGLGLAISAVDNLAAGGHVSPVVIVALLLAAAAAIGGWAGWPGWPAALAVCLPVPAAHLVKHALGLPDTIQPNTYDSIAMMALFCAAVAGAGFVAGALLRQAVSDPTS